MLSILVPFGNISLKITTVRGFPDWGMRGVPPTSQKFAPPLEKFPLVDSPHQIFSHSLPKVNYPPLNKTVVIAPVPLLF